MGGLDELDLVAELVEAAEDAVDAVAGIAVDAPDTVPVEPLEDVGADRLSHAGGLPTSGYLDSTVASIATAPRERATETRWWPSSTA